MSTPKYARGVVTLTIDGETVELRCTPRAAAAISKATDGLQNALSALIAIDYPKVVTIFAAASGRSGEAADDAVFGYGITPTARVLYQYILMLLNGGRTEEERRADAEEAERGNGAVAAVEGEAAAS
ncbi:hypothetical protein [Azospirillum agricola]|uniref:hypothetical protein n=1 Tax=Azospirillum agricola TaxID=1720247 RepID=UPI000A0F369C|nr:hypothetical protein [Azospirillum agricola]SMH30548.1 hypothetical protein SAMN02982994_0332 [Azospirillum lipoferum]